jgi:hypothetical protein
MHATYKTIISTHEAEKANMKQQVSASLIKNVKMKQLELQFSNLSRLTPSQENNVYSISRYESNFMSDVSSYML